MTQPEKPPSDALFAREYEEGTGCGTQLQGIGCGVLAFVMAVYAVGSAIIGNALGCFAYGAFGWLFAMLAYRLWLSFTHRPVHWLAVTAEGVQWVCYAMNAKGSLERRAETILLNDLMSLELDDPLNSGACSYANTKRDRLRLPAHLLRERADVAAFRDAVLKVAPGTPITGNFEPVR